MFKYYSVQLQLDAFYVTVGLINKTADVMCCHALRSWQHQIIHEGWFIAAPQNL